jgi:anhydro-N-acetylmuramic acid kinase
MATFAEQGIWAGAMSGTSADGVDVAFIRAGGTVHGAGAMSGTSADDKGPMTGVDVAFQLIGFYGSPFPATLRRDIVGARKENAKLSLSAFSQLAEDISNAYISTLKNGAAALGILFDNVDAIGVHGQTLFHAPPQTLQLINAPLIASALNCPVVFDFRRADCAAGGQGAPLVPFADVALFQSTDKNRVLLNLGGIANLSIVPAAVSGLTDTSSVRAFDTGPANCISDALCGRHSAVYCEEMGLGVVNPSSVPITFDDGGRLALKGKVSQEVLRSLLEDPYFSPSTNSSSSAKSTDTPQMIRAFGKAVCSLNGSRFDPEDPLGAALSASSSAPSSPFSCLADALATACAFTAETVARGVASGIKASTASLPHPPKTTDWELIVSGGGAFNARILSELKSRLVDSPPTAGPEEAGFFRVTSIAPSSEALGMPESAKEAVAFALLARATMLNTPNNLPSCTGASSPVVGGCIAPAPLPHLRRAAAPTALSSSGTPSGALKSRGNLLDTSSIDASALPKSTPHEVFETIAESCSSGADGGASAGKVRIERILSYGNAVSDEGFWYDQEQNEWVGVMEGEAELSIIEEEGKEPRRVILKQGDWVDIKAHQKHRVEATKGPAEGKPCIWLAVFYSP